MRFDFVIFEMSKIFLSVHFSPCSGYSKSNLKIVQQTKSNRDRGLRHRVGLQICL